MSGGPSDQATLPVPADSVATFRVLVSGPAIEGEQALQFTVRDPNTGEAAIRHESFIGPSTGQGASP
jgi:hypothetical protein